MIVQYDESAHDVASFFCKPPYCIQILIGIRSSTLLIVANFLCMGVDRKKVNKEFLPRVPRECIKMVKYLHIQSVKGKVVNVESIMPLFVDLSDLCVGHWFEAVKNVAVDVLLGPSLSNIAALWARRYRALKLQNIPIWTKLDLRLLRSVKLMNSKTSINSMYDDITLLNVTTNSLDVTIRDKHYLDPIAHQIKI